MTVAAFLVGAIGSGLGAVFFLFGAGMLAQDSPDGSRAGMVPFFLGCVCLTLIMVFAFFAGVVQ